jgi:hypothetical protein
MMKIEIEIANKLLKDGIRFGLEWCLYEDFDCEVLDAVGVPSADVLITELLNNQAFMKKFSKDIKLNLESGRIDLEEAISEAADVGIFQKALKPWVTKCEKEQKRFDTEQKEMAIAEDIQQTISYLEKNGYKVTKK